MPVFTANIPSVLKVGDRIEIGGKIKENARKMSVNLCAQEGEEPRDVVLHFDVRFHRDNIISLSRKNGVWIGSGNYDTNYNMFVPGTIFRIVFEIKDTDVITIYCQGKFHSNFLPKIPLSMAKYIVAWADVERVTHCYFHLGLKGPLEEPGSQSPRLGIVGGPTVAGDAKRCSSAADDHDYIVSPEKSCSDPDPPRVHKKSAPGSPHIERSTNESSDDDQTVQPGKPRMKEGRADRFFYETLLCQPPEPNFISGRRRDSTLRPRQDYRKYPPDISDTDKVESEDTEEILSKNMDSSIADSEEVLPGMKKRSRRGKFAPFSQVVNFMGKKH